MKKTLSIILTLTVVITLAGCSFKLPFGKNSKEETVAYGLQAVSATMLQNNCFYIKNADSFFLLPEGLKNYSGTTDKPGESRIIAFGQDDANIPTMYRDDALVFYSRESQVMSFDIERFLDNGYSIGAIYLTENNGKYYYETGKSNAYPGSSFATAMNQLQEQMPSASILIDSVNGTVLSEDNVSKSGTVKGLDKNGAAVTNAYVGTSLASMQLTADTHFLESFEVYELSDYSLSTEGYAVIHLPDYLLSGYYTVNGGGVFRYVANDRSNGIAGVDFNLPYFYNVDGTTLTLSEYRELTSPKVEESSALEDADAVYVLNIDGTLPGMTFKLSFEDKNANDPNPEQLQAELVSPVGERYELTPDEKDPYTMTAHIGGTYAGDWTINVKNIDKRKLKFLTELETGNATSYVHTGRIGTLEITEITAKQTADIYTVTWENSERAASIELTDPKGKKYSTATTPDAFIENSYGSCSIKVDSVPAGKWMFVVTGDSLGRVWVERKDLQPEPEAVPEEETKAE